MMRRAGLAVRVAAVVAVAACVRTSTTVLIDATPDAARRQPARSATNLPQAFVVITPARVPGDCPPRLQDTGLRTVLSLEHSIKLPVRDSAGVIGYTAYGDYTVVPRGAYGDEEGEGLRLDCARLRALGVVRLDGVSDTAVNPDALEAAATRVVAFLQGRGQFDSVRVAGTVTLHLAPEGGGGSVALRRAQLRDRANWVIEAPGGTAFSLVPPPDATVLTVQAGTHFNCRATSLASRVPELGDHPHVGIRLVPSGAASCLQSWNVTLVFRADAGEPELFAAVYDQWEW